MLKISVLPEEEKQTLLEGERNSKKKYFRDRCQAIQLSSEGFTVKELCRIYKTQIRTIHTWIHNYENYGFLGLKIKSGRGLKSKLKDLTENQIVLIKDKISENPQSLREVCIDISKNFGFTITKLMLKKYLKKN